MIDFAWDGHEPLEALDLDGLDDQEVDTLDPLLVELADWYRSTY